MEPRSPAFHAFAAKLAFFAGRSCPGCPIVIWMNRRHFVGLATSAIVAQGLPAALAATPLKPMALGVVISPYGAPEENLRQAHEWAFPTFFLSMDKSLGSFPPALATQYRDLLAKYQLTATSVEVVGPGPLEWNFTHGPSTIGLVPPKTRAARIDALRQVSDFAKQVGIRQVQTHCGFIPRGPARPSLPASRGSHPHRRQALPGQWSGLPYGDGPGDAHHHVA